LENGEHRKHRHEDRRRGESIVVGNSTVLEGWNRKKKEKMRQGNGWRTGQEQIIYRKRKKKLMITLKNKKKKRGGDD
jgi:hypothetical protein